MKKFTKSNKHSSSKKETLYLPKSPKNAELKQAVNDFEANKDSKTTSLQFLIGSS